MGELTLREYQGISIPQRQDGYINATAMCKAGGKEWSNFRQLKSTNEYLEALESVLGIPRTELISTVQGVPVGGRSHDQGTWVHPRIASRLAQWISPEFAVVVDGWVLDILSGKHPMPNEVSHEGAIARNLAALMESQTLLLQSTAGFQAAMQQIAIETRTTSVAVEHLGTRVEKIDTEVEQLANEVRRRRKDFTRRTQSIYKSVVWRYYNGCCPIFRHIKILDSEIVRTMKCKYTISELDHWYASHKNQLHEGWLISSEAHAQFEKNTRSRDKYHSAFREFQRNVDAYVESTEGIQRPLFPDV